MNTFVFPSGTFVGGYTFTCPPTTEPKPTEPVPQTQRKCECGVWSTGGLHSDWCPCAGGDCVQKEDR